MYGSEERGCCLGCVWKKKNTPKCITLTEIHLMWKHGADLLSTHSESQKNHVTVINFTGWWQFTDNVCHGQTLQTQTQPCALLSRKALFHGFISSFGFNIKFQHSNHTVQSQMGLLESNAFKQATSTAPCHVVCLQHKAQNRDKNMAKLGFRQGSASESPMQRAQKWSKKSETALWESTNELLSHNNVMP